MIICVAGMIGVGKSSLTKLVAEELGTKAFYESVEGNPVLEKFYTSTEEAILKHRYPFLLQLYFLNDRFKSIKEAIKEDDNVLDRSIYEDWYFAKINHDLGRITPMEFSIYENLLHNMLEELDSLPKKAPDLLIYIKASFETVLERIQGRGRGFELDPALREYYYKLWEGYDEWLFNTYNYSKVVIINADKYDYVNNSKDAAVILERIKYALQ